jgi:uncharacterized protein (TIGR03086 family)
MALDPITLYGLATDEFGARLARVGAAGWVAPTPCDQWTVRDLVRHVVEEDLWAVGLLGGLTLDEAGAKLPADPLAPDPATAYAAAVDAALAVARQDGAAERTVHLSFGDTPAGEYLMQLTADHVVHAWDLATALLGDDRLPAELTAAVLEWFGPQEGAYRAAGVIGPRPALPDHPDDLTRLLAAFGRTR